MGLAGRGMAPDSSTCSDRSTGGAGGCRVEAGGCKVDIDPENYHQTMQIWFNQ